MAYTRLRPRDEDDPRINPEGTSGWATINVLLSWQASEKIGLGLRLQNLGDRSYRKHGSGIDAAGRNIGIWIDSMF
jgi:outer membrane receptor protein involved in Fe transport